MRGVVVDVRFDNDLSDGQAVRFPLHWFSVLDAATVTESEPP